MTVSRLLRHVSRMRFTSRPEAISVRGPPQDADRARFSEERCESMDVDWDQARGRFRVFPQVMEPPESPSHGAYSDALNEGPAGVLVVVPITSTKRDLPSHIEIDDVDSGLDEVSYAKCEDLKSISEKRLVARLGAVESLVLAKIERVLRYLLDL